MARSVASVAETRFCWRGAGIRPANGARVTWPERVRARIPEGELPVEDPRILQLAADEQTTKGLQTDRMSNQQNLNGKAVALGQRLMLHNLVKLDQGRQLEEHTLRYLSGRSAWTVQYAMLGERLQPHPDRLRRTRHHRHSESGPTSLLGTGARLS